MITFRHADQRIQLGAGETWSAPSADNTYRDAPTSDLQAIVREVENGIPWREAVGRYYAEANPWLHQTVTSVKRDLFFRNYPPFPGAKVIDIGAGWGQLSLPLAQHTEVTALEPTPERLAFIRAAATQVKVASHMHFIQADFFEVEFESRFDLACCIGVLEWVPKFRKGDPRDLQLEFLRRIHSLLNPEGQLVLGIENRMGLKYLLGTADDHLGRPNIAIYDTDLAARKWQKITGQDLRSFTHTKLELEELLKLAGFYYTAFYAAIPDYKLPEIILPLGSSAEDHFARKPHILEHDGTNGRPLSDEQQDELRSHYRSLARMGIAGNFAPSFFVVAERAQTGPPSSGKILGILRQAEKIESVDEIRLEIYQANITRKDCDEKWAYKVVRGDEVLFHLTLAKEGLNQVYERTKAFAQACPNLACRPLFFFEAEESSLQFFGQEYLEGETLDSAVSRGACGPEEWITAVNTATAALKGSTCFSSQEAYDREFEELKNGVLSFEVFGMLDRHLLREWVFPILFEAGRRTPLKARWTNGDFVGRNLLRNSRGDIRLIDCEFARMTHFFHADSFRLLEFSVLPSELGAFPFSSPRESMPAEELHFLLQHVQMLRAVVRPQFFLHDVPTIMERILTLASRLSQDQSQVLSMWLASNKQARSITLERDALRNERDALRDERDALHDERDALHDERDALHDERDALHDERDALRDKRDALRHERDAAHRQTIESYERIAKLDSDVEHLKVTRFEAKRECHSMRTSLSWRLTWPLRIVRDAGTAFLNQFKRPSNLSFTTRMQIPSKVEQASAAVDVKPLALPVFDTQPIVPSTRKSRLSSGDGRRLICVSHVMPYPPQAGNEYRIHRMLTWLAERNWDILLVVCPLPNETVSKRKLAEAAGIYQNLIVCQRDGTLLHQLSDGGAMLEGLRGRPPREFSPLLGETERGNDCERKLLAVMRAFCPDVLAELLLHLETKFDPQVLLAEYVFMTRPFTMLRPELFKIIDTIDVFSTTHDKVVRYGIEDGLALDSEIEAKLLNRADLVIAIQAEEAEALRKLAPHRQVISVGVDFTLVNDAPLSATRPVILLVGSDNARNTKGLKDFLRFAWPPIRRELPEAELRVIGSLGKAAGPALPGVQILGRVEDLCAAYAEARVIINPAVAGTGLKIKTVEALCHLRPIVLWPSGVEGLEPEMSGLCHVASNWFDFARHVIRLAGEEDGARVLIDKRATLAQQFAPDSVYAPLGAVLDTRQIATLQQGQPLTATLR